MTSEEEKILVNECLSWKGTPWKHGIGLKGFGVDCAYFVKCVFVSIGMYPNDFEIEPYSRDWSLHSEDPRIKNCLTTRCTLLQPSEGKKIGDILIFKFGKANGHMGIYLGSAIKYMGNEAFIHAQRMRGVIIDNFMLPVYQEHFRETWRVD